MRLLSSTLHRKSRSTAARRRRLLLEQLEDRRPLAVFTVTNTLDSGLGSLRQAILDANAAGNVGGPDSLARAIEVLRGRQ